MKLIYSDYPPGVFLLAHCISKVSVKEVTKENKKLVKQILKYVG